MPVLPNTARLSRDRRRSLHAKNSTSVTCHQCELARYLKSREQISENGRLCCGKSPGESGECREDGGTIRLRGEQCREQSERCEQRGRQGPRSVLISGGGVFPVRQERHSAHRSASAARTVVGLVADDLDQAQRGQRAVLLVCSCEVVETVDRRAYHAAMESE